MSENGKKLLKEWEGCEYIVYKDVAGYLTIGVGHKLIQDELTSGKIWIGEKPIKYRNGLTEDQVMTLLSQDLERFEKVVNENIKVELNQNQFDTLVSFSFNVGVNAFKNSTLLRLLNQNLYERVPGELKRWIYSGGNRIDGLIKRREKEIILWNS